MVINLDLKSFDLKQTDPYQKGQFRSDFMPVRFDRMFSSLKKIKNKTRNGTKAKYGSLRSVARKKRTDREQQQRPEERKRTK